MVKDLKVRMVGGPPWTRAQGLEGKVGESHDDPIRGRECLIILEARDDDD